MIEATYNNPIKLYRDGNVWCAQYPMIQDRIGTSRLVTRCDANPLQAVNEMLEAVREYQQDVNQD